MAVDAEVIGSVVIVGLTLSLVFSWFLYKGWGYRKRAQLVRGTPTETPATARPGDSVALTGTIHGRGESVTAPISGEDGVLAVWTRDVGHFLRGPLLEGGSARLADCRIRCRD